MLSVPCVIISALLLSGSLKYILNYSDVSKKKKITFFLFYYLKNMKQDAIIFGIILSSTGYDAVQT